MKLFRKARFFWVYPLVAALFLTAATSEASLRLGSVLVLLGEALRLWADGFVGHVKVNFTQRWRNDPKIGRLITGGPYAHVRHPLYVGTFLIGAGFCAATKSLPLTAAALAFFLLVYRKKAEREEQIILGEWGEEYAKYQRLVPRWLPAFRRYPHRHGRWSWKGINASREWKTLIWVIVALLALYLREEWFIEHDVFGEHRWLKQALLASAAVALMATDGLIELVRRRRKARAAAPPRAAQTEAFYGAR